jgi:hypothetical protein
VALTLAVAALSLAVSSTTAWLTLLRRGTVQMTQPTQIFFGPSDAHRSGKMPIPKVYLRTLLFTTSKRGRVVENMYVALTRHDAVNQHFNIWIYGERLELVRGSGLFVGENGVAANHHFLLGPGRREFAFTAGRYQVEVVARLVGDRTDKRLFLQEIVLTDDLASALRNADTGVYFDWAPDASRCVSHIERHTA